MPNHSASGRRPAPWILLVFFVGFALPGCGGRMGTVKGKVLISGRPMPNGTVAFVSADGQSVDTSEIDAEGNYTMRRAPVGPVKISVIVSPPSNIPSPNMKMGDKGGRIKSETAGKKFVPVPERYRSSETTPLTYTVTSGEQSHNVEIEP